MSWSWRGGSTRAWRRLRAVVAARDGYRCRIGLPGVCKVTAPLTGPDAGHLHHTQGKATTGNDPRYLVWSCAPCNLKIGNPTRSDPAPQPRTRW